MNLYKLKYKGNFFDPTYNILSIEKISNHDINSGAISVIRIFGYLLNVAVVIINLNHIHNNKIPNINFDLLHSKALTYLREEKLKELL